MLIGGVNSRLLFTMIRRIITLTTFWRRNFRPMMNQFATAYTMNGTQRQVLLQPGLVSGILFFTRVRRRVRVPRLLSLFQQRTF